MLQCPLCGVVPATCLTQDGLPSILINMGYYWCTATSNYVIPTVVPDKAAAEAEELEEQEQDE